MVRRCQRQRHTGWITGGKTPEMLENHQAILLDKRGKVLEVRTSSLLVELFYIEY